jgi:hypothetical protein
MRRRRRRRGWVSGREEGQAERKERKIRECESERDKGKNS